jgi:MFS family permease
VGAQTSVAMDGATRSVVRRRDFRLLLTSFATSRLGDFLYLVALSAYVFEQTGSPGWVSAAVLARFVPYVFLSPFAGVIADRYERRNVMAIGDGVQLVAMLALTVTAALGAAAALVILLAVLAAAAATLYQAAASALVASTVPEDELASANSLMSTVSEVAFVAGPAAGGLLLLLGDPVWAFGINAATFAVSAGLLLAIRTRSGPRPAVEGRGVVRELAEGLAALLGHRTIAVLVGCAVAASVVYGVELVVLILVSSELLGTGSEGLGWLLAASGTGGVTGAVLSPRLARSRRPRIVIAVLVLMTGVPLAVLAAVRLPALAYSVLVLEGIAIVALTVLVETALQRGVPAVVLGRLSGLVLSVTSVGTAAGTLVAPVLVAWLGLLLTLVVAGLLPVVLAASGLALLGGFDEEVDRRRRELAPRVALLERLRLLDGAGPAALERLAAAAVEERVPAGTVLLRQGDPPDDLLVLAGGNLVVDHADDGVVRRINTMTAPDYLGEIGLVEGSPRTATVTTATDAVLWRVPGRVFLDAVSGGSALSAVVTGGITTRLARTATLRG